MGERDIDIDGSWLRHQATSAVRQFFHPAAAVWRWAVSARSLLAATAILVGWLLAFGQTGGAPLFEIIVAFGWLFEAGWLIARALHSQRENGEPSTPKPSDHPER